MGDCVSGGGLPLQKLVALSEPLSSNVSVELDLVGATVGRRCLHSEVCERDRLVHKIRRLSIR